jgi:hypothetical protein
VGVTELTNMQVSAKYQGNADEWVQRLFPDLRRPHDLRAMYASLVYKGFSCGRMTFNRVFIGMATGVPVTEIVVGEVSFTWYIFSGDKVLRAPHHP